MTEQERQQEQASIKAAWADLALDKSFAVVLEKDLQRKFNLARESFRVEEGFNPIPAAQRDGQRMVIAHILKRLGIAKHMLDEDEEPAPAKVISEFQGMNPDKPKTRRNENGTPRKRHH